MSTQRVPTARDDLGLIFLAAMFAVILVMAATFITTDSTTATPADTVTGNTAAPAVIFNGGAR